MTPGLALDTGEFIPASELNRRIDVNNTVPTFYNRQAIEREIESIENPHGMRLNDAKERPILPGGSLRRLLVVIDAQAERIAELEAQNAQLTASLETASSAVIVLKQQQRERWAQLASGHLVDKGALRMVVNALRRDASEGKTARGEMADALEAQIASADAPAASGETYCKNTDAAWAQFCGGVGDGPSAPHPGMIRAFESYYGQSFADKEWRTEASVWAAAWGKAKPEQQVASGQEPVAWMTEKDDPMTDKNRLPSWERMGMTIISLYTHPAPAQQPLGIEEIQKLAADNATGWFLGPLTFARAIEAKHGIKGKP